MALDSKRVLFLSYSHADQAAAAELRERLRGQGFDVFKDDASLRAGDRWFDRLEAVLGGCDAFAVLVGREGLARWVGAETQVALARHFGARGDVPRLPILPVLLDEVGPEALPPFLSLFQVVRWGPGRPLPPEMAGGIDAGRWPDAIAPARETATECPYRGLAAFRPGDGRYFFGRTAETLAALRGLGDAGQANPGQMRGLAASGFRRWLQVEGNSGSGKSSLVQAGLLPLIERGALWGRTGFAHWQVLGPMMPGQDPLSKLAESVEFALKSDPQRRDIAGLAQRLRTGGADGLALHLRNFKAPDTAFLLVVDQFEELFTTAEPQASRLFAAQLAQALADPECPLFLVTTIRADFLDRMDSLVALAAAYNERCQRYLLPPISSEGLREAIEMPARLAGIDVSEVTAAILADASDEIGALPLVGNALVALWEVRRNDGGRVRLSGQAYQQQGRLAGMLIAGADALLASVERARPGHGRTAALELLLGLVHIQPDGRHSRRRISREEAVAIAGRGDEPLGEFVLRRLAGERPEGVPSNAATPVMRLVTLSRSALPEGGEATQVDLIHETLIRDRGGTGRGDAVPYWPTLHAYIDANRDRDLLRQQLELQVDRWQRRRGLMRVLALAGGSQLWRYRRLRIPLNSVEGRYLARSRAFTAVLAAVVLAVVAPLLESLWWASANNLPIHYALVQLAWYAGHAPLPTAVPLPAGRFTMGCVLGRDDLAGQCPPEETPPVEVVLERPCAMAINEVTFLEYDYYVWSTGGKGAASAAYVGSGFGRDALPVVNVNWRDANRYAAWLSRYTGQPWRLPSEREWEYAARAGQASRYGWGSELGAGHANCNGCDARYGNVRTAPVASYGANAWGLQG